jgi:thiol:disulfide interchange protein DsbC
MRFYCFLLSALFSVSALAEGAQVPTGVENAINRLKAHVSIANYEVATTPVKGLYEVLINNNEILYFSEDGEYLLLGDLRKADDKLTNLTEQRMDGVRKAKINNLKEEEMVVFAPEGETKHTLNVFTDVDCFYCVKLHREVDKLNEAGVKVRYMAFPRAGIGSETYRTMVSVWCADDQQAALTAAKNKQKVEPKTCDNPIQAQYKLGQELGVRGTPAILFDNGQLMPGYAPADKLIQMLEQAG